MIRMLILYVEDNFENKLFVRRVIESMGHEMLEAETGYQSLEVAAETPPDLILMDINTGRRWDSGVFPASS